MQSSIANGPLWRTRWLALLLGSALLAGCPGSLENPERFPELPLVECTLSIDVEQDLFPMYCSGEGCHAGEDPAAGLRLFETDAFANMVGRSSESCGPAFQLINPDDVLESFLLKKITNTHPNGCGDQMPLASRLDTQQIACITRWIQEGLGESPSDGGVRDAGTDVGTDSGGEDSGTEDSGAADAESGSICGAISSADGVVVCVDTETSCQAWFGNSTGCNTLCESAGLSCDEAWPLRGECGANRDGDPLGCDTDSETAYCECVP